MPCEMDMGKGYFMTDSSTWVAAKKEMDNIKILFRGDPFLINTYHTLCQPEGATDGQPYAAKFIDFAVSDEGQSLIRSFGAKEYGEGLYNDAGFAPGPEDYPGLRQRPLWGRPV